jgi:predicted HNH restriction endonuclease
VNLKNRQAGLQSAKTKGPKELKRAGHMADWTERYGKNDQKNPFSKQNYHIQDLADLAGINSAGGLEGNPRLVQHLRRERNQTLVRQKKNAVLASTGALRCQACQFDFSDKYGDRGVGFCEVHHVKPLSTRTGKVKTCLEDLIVLCSNCHRMIHRTKPWLTLDELHAIITGTTSRKGN